MTLFSVVSVSEDNVCANWTFYGIGPDRWYDFEINLIPSLRIPLWSVPIGEEGGTGT